VASMTCPELKPCPSEDVGGKCGHAYKIITAKVVKVGLCSLLICTKCNIGWIQKVIKPTKREAKP